MRIAYVVVSHRNPSQVLRLVRALNEGASAEVFVRHDQRRSRLADADLERLGARPLHDEIEFEWGDWSQARLLLSCLEAAVEHVDPDWLLVLSGQDYPLRPMAAIEDDLAATGYDAMLGQAWELDTAGVPEPPADEFFLRYAYRHYPAPRATPRLPGTIRAVAYLREMPPPLRPRVGLRRARLPFDDGFRCFVSADWLTLGRRALAAVLAAARDRPRLLRYYRRAAVPSESLFATVLLNDPSLRVARNNRRFVSFAAPLTPHPDTLTSTDLDRLVGSGCDFARKFDMDLDAKVLDALDERRRAGSPR